MTNIRNLDVHENLELVSLKDQRGSQSSSVGIQTFQDTRKLLLAGTRLGSFVPSVSFLNLETLDLAATGLQNLPVFFGQRCRNLRNLNLNYNAIQDIRPLMGIERLGRLHLAANRLSRLRRSTSIIRDFGKNLIEIDLRNNPLSIGFYTPESVSTVRAKSAHKVPKEPQNGMLLLEDGSGKVNEACFSDAENPICQAPSDVHILDQYLLPSQDKQQDTAHHSRLDEDTALRRRVYEMLITNACPRLTRLDGLNVNRIAFGERDKVWDRLVELGVLRGKGCT